jgi:hypothetical protein
MDSMLATEATSATEEKRVTPLPLETWANNERMRHIPALDWMIRKTDVDLRQQIQNLAGAFSNLPSSDPRHPVIEGELRLLGGAIDRLADVAKASRHNNNHGDLASRLDAALTNAVACLRSLEATPFGRRYPFHHGERSKAEPVYASLLAVMHHVEKLSALVREVDPEVLGP